VGVSAVELALRSQIIEELTRQSARNAGIFSYQELAAFKVGGREQRLIDTRKGIWNPADMDVTLSIKSTPNGPYDDEELSGGLLKYRYRAGGSGGDNTKLRAAVNSGAPLILLRWIEPNLFVTVCPVYLVADDPQEQAVMVALDESLRYFADLAHPSEDQRRYAERVARVRLHQPEFRGKVIVAYERRCGICELKHSELLDAAHIVPDSQPMGQPVVPNGIALCKIHHAAYDENLLGIDPDFRVHVNEALLIETDGPMLKHGLQEMHGRGLLLPNRVKDRPDRERLSLRFEEFLRAG
jgi:putative restriction endonuclease